MVRTGEFEARDGRRETYGEFGAEGGHFIVLSHWRQILEDHLQLLG